MDASIPFQQVLEIAGAASGDAAEVDPTGPVCVLPLLCERMVCSSVPGEAGSAAEVQCNFVQQDGEKLSAGSPGMPAIIPHPMQGLANILQVAVDRCREGLPSSANGKGKAGIKECKGTGGGGQAGGEASIAASASRKTGRTTGSSDDEDLINPFKKKKLSGGVLSSRPRWRADVIVDVPSLSDMMAASSARDETSVSLYHPPVLPDLTSEQFMYIKCMVLGNNFDLDIAPFHDQVRHLKHLDTYIKKIGQSSKVLSMSKEDAVAYVDAVLVKLKGDGDDGNDGDAHSGFPGIGQADDDTEARGWETVF